MGATRRDMAMLEQFPPDKRPGRVGSKLGDSQGTLSPQPSRTRDRLTLNLAEVSFSARQFRGGRLPYETDEAYAALRQAHRETHTFRFDARTNEILNIGTAAEIKPLGRSDDLVTSEHLLLLGKAVQQTLLRWLAKRRVILRPLGPLQCWGARKATLLSAAIKELNLTPRAGLEVFVRHSFDTRVLRASRSGELPFLALLLDVSTSNQIEIPISELIASGVDVTGYYVCRRFTTDTVGDVLPRLEALGRVAAVEHGRTLILTDIAPGVEDRVPASAVMLEPRQENLEHIVSELYGTADGPRILEGLAVRRAPYVTALGKLEKIAETLDGIRSSLSLSFGEGLLATIGPLLQDGDRGFPDAISTSRPSFLFGPQGRQTGQYPDSGVTKFGPYQYMQHERNEPLLIVVCERRNRGRVDQFVKSLRDGIDDDLWREAMSRRKKAYANPFHGGLVGKFRLQRVQLEFEEVTDTTPEGYRAAIARVLQRLPRSPDLGLVQTEKCFEDLPADRNPYLAAKAAFMTAGVPMQAVHVETMEAADGNLAYTLNNLALAVYAKLGGTPFVMSTRGPATHELVIGLGYSEVSESRFGPKARYVGITTVFQGDGRYLISHQTREVEFSEYADALLESLRTTVRFVSEANNWQGGDEIRLVFHVYKPLKYREINAIKALVSDLVTDRHAVKYAFLDISHHHDFRLFDPSQQGVQYWSIDAGGKDTKGEGVPVRGCCLQLNDRSVLLQLVGPNEVKTSVQGLPSPLLIDVHSESDFTDLIYLARQAFHFSYLSWRSFFPSHEPVTIAYSRLIASALGNLKLLPRWDSSVLTGGQLRNSMWFL